MGYKLADSVDELVLPKVSQLIFEVCFELLLGQVELDRIMAVLDFANNSFELSDEVTIRYWEEYVQSKRSAWCLKDCEEFIKEKVYQARENAKKSSQMMSYLPRDKIISEQSTAVKYSGPQSFSGVVEQKERTRERSNSDEVWMYADEKNTTEQLVQRSSNSQKDMTVPSDKSTSAKYRHQAGSPEGSQQECVITQTSHRDEGTDRSVHGGLRDNTIYRPPPSPNSPPYPNPLDHYSKSGKPVDDSPMGNVNVRMKDCEFKAKDEILDRYGYRKISRSRSNSMTRDRPKIYKDDVFESRVADMIPPSSDTQRENQHLKDYRSMDGLADTYENIHGRHILQDMRNDDVEMPIDSTVRPLTSNGRQDADIVNARMRTSPLPHSALEIHQAQFYKDLPGQDIPHDMRRNEGRMPIDATVTPLTSNYEHDADNAVTRTRPSPLPPNAPDIYQVELCENVPGRDIYQAKRRNDGKMQRDSTVRPITSSNEQAPNNISTHNRSSALPPNPPVIYQAQLNDSSASNTHLPGSETQRMHRFQGASNLQSKSEPLRSIRAEAVHGTYWDGRRSDTHGVEIPRDSIVKSFTSNSKYSTDTGSIRALGRREHLWPTGQKYSHLENKQRSSAFSANESGQSEQQRQRINLEGTRVPSFEKPRSFDAEKDTPAIYGGPAKSVTPYMVDEKSVILENSKKSMPNEYAEVYF